jgi:hypothetical protein
MSRVYELCREYGVNNVKVLCWVTLLTADDPAGDSLSHVQRR